MKERALVENTMALFFERVFKIIFGSQIKAMEMLQGQNDSTCEISQFYKIYEEDHYPEAIKNVGYASFTDWLGYIKNYCLFVSEHDSKITLTDDGKAFLYYIKYTREYKDIKPL